MSETGVCLLSHKDPAACPHFSVADAEAVNSGSDVHGAGESPLPSPENVARQFPPGLELGTEDASEIMRARYAHVVGVLGSWNAGKTCFLLSLYLMASRGALPNGFIFAGSQTLQGFEARARRLRRWKAGPLPEQLADHTNLADPRQPAMLHLALRRTGAEERLFDLLLSDIPGEWSKSLVDRAATADRFGFLRRADGVIVVVDGPLLNSTSRHAELQRSKYLLERLVHSVGVASEVPVVLLVSKVDEMDGVRPASVDELERHGRAIGLNMEVVLCAAFSRMPQKIANGLGVFETVEKILAAKAARSRVPFKAPEYSGTRAFLRFGQEV